MKHQAQLAGIHAASLPLLSLILQGARPTLQSLEDEEERRRVEERVLEKEERSAEIAAARRAMMRQIKDTQKSALLQQDQLKVEHVGILRACFLQWLRHK